MIDNDLVRSGLLSPYELAVYVNLLSRKGNKNTAWPAHALIAKDTSMSPSKVKLCIKQLQAYGLIAVNHRYLGPGKQTSNEYQVFNKSNQLGLGNRQPHRDYEEDSFAEESMRKSSTKSNKSSWRFINAGAPATESQLSFIKDLQEKTGDFEFIDNYPELAELSNLHQGQAHELIQHLWIQLDRQQRFK